MPQQAGPRWEESGLVRRQREQGENVGKSLHGGFCGKGWVRQGKLVWLVGLSHFRGVWGPGVVASCLVPCPGMVGQVDSGPVCWSVINKVIGYGSGLVCTLKVRSQVICCLLRVSQALAMKASEIQQITRHGKVTTRFQSVLQVSM